MERIQEHINAEGQLRITEESLQMVFETFHAQLLFYVSRIIEEEEQAKDIVMNKWAKMWEIRNTLIFLNVNKLKSYLYEGCYNEAIDFLRKKKAHGNYKREVITSTSVVEEPDSHRREFIITEVIANVYREISDLPPLQQKTILLKLEGKSMQEISAEIGISYNAASRNFQRATESLRKTFGGNIPVTMAMVSLGLMEIHSLLQFITTTNTLPC